MDQRPGESESQWVTGGAIPGAPGIPAFALSGSSLSSVPVMLAVPHAGRAYPSGLLRDMRHPAMAALRLEDRLVDHLGRAIARETGAPLLVAHAPRAMIDLNRAPDDVDWEMFVKADRPGAAEAPSRRARNGLGLIPRRLPGMGELWRRRHEPADLAARIDGIHKPYHEALAGALGDLRARWGAALLIDLHSMPPLPTRPGGAPRLVLGDRFGSACHGSLTGAAFAYLAAHDCAAAHNRPYAGGYVLERHAEPAGGLHAMQVEIDRSVYLDERLAELGPHFDSIVTLLVGLVRHLAAEVCAMGEGDQHERWDQAAE